MSTEFETNRLNQERNRENRETNQETKDDQELKAAAAMERADFLGKEVKTSQNQLQNLILHIQAVAQAIKELRATLDLPNNIVDQPTSLQEDEKRISELRKRINEYKQELINMKDQLIEEQIKDHLRKNPQMSNEIIRQEVKAKVMKMYTELGI